MRTKIIKTTKRLLKVDGLKFTVDDLASELNISKKTIYKYFANKEALAKEVYGDIYTNLKKDLKRNNKEATLISVKVNNILTTYYWALYYSQEEIFKRHSIMLEIQEYLTKEVTEIWEELEETLEECNNKYFDFLSLRLVVESSLISFFN